MRWLTIGVAVLALLWSAWWFVGARAVERGALAGIEAARAEGWAIEYDDLSVAGFPNRFDTTVTAPRLAAPDGQVTWSAPFLQVFALSYRPNQVIAVAPEEMRFDLPAGEVRVASGDLRASATFSPSTEPELDRATIVARSLAATGGGIELTLEAAQLAIRRIDGDTTYDVALDAGGLWLGEASYTALDPFASLPPTIETMDADLSVSLDRPLGAGGAAEVTGIDLRSARLRWGELQAQLAGVVRIDAAGFPEGQIGLEMEGWQAALRLLAAAGVVGTEQLSLLSAGLAGMEEEGRIALDFVLEGGEMRLGPIPLGPAPRF